MTTTSSSTVRELPADLSVTVGGGANGTPKRRRLQPAGYLWILPALLVSVGIIYYSIVYTGYISTLNWDGSSPNPPSVGFQNYIQAFNDPVFWQSILHPIIFYVVTVVVQSALALVFAVLLHSKVRLAAVYKVLLFIPVVIAPAVMAPVFREIFAADGQFNWILQHVGLGFLAQPWLAQPSTALAVVISISIWEWTGLTFILYYSAMTQIEPETLEAARIDGAGNFRMILSIILPSVRGTTIAIATLGAINALKTFDIPYLVTSGGPNFATEFLGTFIYRESIPDAQVGYGGALSILLIIISLALALILNVRNFRGRGTRV
jgi:raffinose/stachyose/melibiose transport system permease protein